jgi:hypothetical protein
MRQGKVFVCGFTRLTVSKEDGEEQSKMHHRHGLEVTEEENVDGGGNRVWN